MTASTRPGFLGADVDALQRLTGSLSTAAQSFTSVKTRIGKELAGLEWYGTDGTSFRQLWTSSYGPALQRISDVMSTVAGEISRQREQQEAVSAGSGGGPSAGTAGGGGASSAVGSSAAGGPATTSPSAASPTPAPVDPSGATPPQAAAGAQAPVALKVPFYGQFVAGHGFTPGGTACLKASKAMAAQLGATVLGPDQRIQVATGENSDGSVRADAAQAAAGRSYIDDQLDSGKPVVVGVSHKGGYQGNVDHITDHFVVITGRGTDADGSTYYTFNDPATSHPSKGSDANVANRFRLNEDGVMVSAGSVAKGYIVDRHIEVSMVRRNG